MHANVQVQLFPDKIFPLTLPRLLANIPEISLTAVKFPDISRFSIQVVTLQTVLRELAYGQRAAWLAYGQHSSHCRRTNVGMEQTTGWTARQTR